jgi:two-component system sensor histidine kinase BarA
VSSVEHASLELASALEKDTPYDAILYDCRLDDEDIDRVLESVQQLGNCGAGLPILLTSTSRYSALKFLEKSGHARSIISTPPRLSELYSSVGKSGNSAAREVPATTARDTLPANDERPLAGNSILVADDNEINRKLAGRILRDLGATVSEVKDGIEAVDAVVLGHYDLILMDVHMPGMDGMEATGKIRSLPGDRSRIPVVALTANAMQGDKERFLTAAMDDYLPKPLTVESIQAVVGRWCRAGSLAEHNIQHSDETATEHKALQVLDQRLGIRLAAGDPDIWRQSINILCDTLPEEMVKMDVALADKDTEQLRRLAHKLHGSTSYCGTTALKQALKALEDYCNGGAEKNLPALVEDVRREADRLMELCRQPGFPGALEETNQARD